MAEQCEICTMYFQDKYALQGHLGGKKHLKRLEQVQVVERSVFVSPLPKFISAHRLLEFFQKYGAIKYHKFGPSYLIIEFCDRSSTEVLLKNPVWIKNVKLNIKKRTLHNDFQKQKTVKENNPTENKASICYENIKHIFKEKTTFDNQLVTFINAVRLTDEEIETKYESICVQLDKIFKVVFPKCKTYKFGSTQTGLGFKECDLDIYMDIGEPIYETKGTSTDAWTMQKIFKETKRLMYGMNCLFSNIILIPKAKIPIIKFCYVRTNVSCDISFKNSLGIYKSNLIKYCVSFDSRLQSLMLLIKYWARHFKISGSGKICNYALVLLIIFYLQQPSVNIIPPLMFIQNTSQPQLINGWQVNINENIVLPPTTNKNSIPQLLHGFFFFYASFAFKSHVICPIDGMVHTISEFKDIENLPPYMDRYKECVRENENLKLNINNVICVQDPIELISNVTAFTAHSTLDTFVKYCALGAEICAITSTNDYKDLLESLFTRVLENKVTKNKFKVAIFANKFPHVMNAIEKKIFTKNDWYFTVFNIVKDIFEKVFKVNIQALTADVGAKQQELEALSDVHSEKVQKIIFHCTGSHCIWRNRKINSIIIDPTLSYLQKEALMSEQTIENFDKDKTSNTINLDFTCTFEKKHPLKVILTISNNNCDNHIFHEFTCFARRKLTDVIGRTLVHMQ